MSGHSKWATTKHKKALIDAKRSKSFTKLIREMTVAARMGGGDPDGNPRLRTAILKGKEANMPSDNIKKAIQKGTGELPGVQYEEVTYEGYGPGGVAILLLVMTDNKNRTVPELRKLLGKYNGNMAESGSVSWIFEKRGYVTIEKQSVDEEKLMSLALDAGASDFQSSDPAYFEIFAQTSDFENVKKAVVDAKLKPVTAEVTFLPQTYIALDGKEAEQMLHLVDALEDHDDVQNVYANFDISEEVMATIAEG